MAFQDDKDAVIAVVKAHDCTAAHYIGRNAVDYPTLLDSLFEFAQTFDCDPTYLDQLLSLISLATLNSLGVYYNQVIPGTVTNPVYIAKCTIGTVVLNTAHPRGWLEVVYNSTITLLHITSGAIISGVTVSSDAVISTFTVDNGSTLEALVIKNCGAHKGTVTSITEGSYIQELGVEEGAVFGGFTCPDIVDNSELS
jgi:hypothetical protein